VATMAAEGQAQLDAEGATESAHQVFLDLRYLKQYHEVTMPIARDLLDRGDSAAIADAFHAEHDQLYGYDLRKEAAPLELINVRVQSLGKTDKPPLPRLTSGGPDPAKALKGRRRAFIPEADEMVELPVYDGHQLASENTIEGPALIERVDTTIFVSASFVATVDVLGSVVLRQRDGEAGR